MSDIDYGYVHTGAEDDVEVIDAPPVVVETPATPVAETSAPPVVETPKPHVVEAQTPPVVAQTPATVVTDWKAELKKADKYEALREIGYNDFAIEAMRYYDRTGGLAEYASVKSVDYKTMTPEQLLKIDLQRQNVGMSEKALNFKLNKELNEKYYLDRETYPEGSVEADYGQEQMRLDAEQKRKAFIAEQDKFRAPELQPDLDATNKAAELQQQRASISTGVMNDPATKNLQTAKVIVFGEGEDSFSYPITDAQSFADIALNTILNSGRNDLTGVNLNAFYKQLAMAQPGWEKAHADHHQALAKLKFEKTIGNVTPINSTTEVDAPAGKDYSMRSR